MTSATISNTITSSANTVRLYYLDNLRVLLISLIILLHLVITYGGPGSWYIHEVESADLDMASMIIYSMYNATVQAFALGFFFFISGYFTASSLECKGAWRFTRDRLIRLGIPLAAYTAIINPITVYLLYYREQSFGSFLYDHFAEWRFSTGPMWFVAALLVFSLIYILWRRIRDTETVTANEPASLPHAWMMFLLALATGLAAFVIRFFFRVGWSMPVLNFQLSYFSEYFVTFFLGTTAWRVRWFERLSAYHAGAWLGFAVFMAALLPVMFVCSNPHGSTVPFEGGLNWQSLSYALWEPFVCLGAVVGLSTFFAIHFNRRSGLFGILAPNAYTVYIIHPQVMITLTFAFSWLTLPPLVKFAVMTPIVLTGCFAMAFAIKAIPGMKHIL